MAEARSAPATPSPPITDWTLRPFEATSLAPAWVGVGIWLAFLAVWLTVHNLAGVMEGLTVDGQLYWETPVWWVVFVDAGLVAYIPTALAYSRRGMLRDLRDLRPLLPISEAEFENLIVSTTCVGARRLRVAGLVGFLLGLAIALLDPVLSVMYETASLTDPLYLWMLAYHALTLWLGGRLLITELDTARAYARMGENLVQIDILDLRPLAPFARKGQRTVVIFILASSILSIFWLAPAAATSNVATMLLLLALVTASFVFPVRGVHRRIRRVKHAELDRLREEIRHARNAILQPTDPGEATGSRLADLVAYHGLIERVREWPFGAPTLLRIGLVAMLGMASWLGGAIVERLLDTALR
jgi:hypothetical protein